MSLPTSRDYPQRLYDAARAARDELLNGWAGSTAAVEDTREALDFSQCGLASARLEIAQAEACHDINTYLMRRLSDASLIAGGGIVHATKAADLGNAATTAMNTVALSIKAAAAAMDEVARNMGGIFAITKRGAEEGSIDQTARAASLAVQQASESLEELKTRALEANVEAVAACAPAGLQAMREASDAIVTILAGMETARSQSAARLVMAEAGRAEGFAAVHRGAAEVLDNRADASALSDVLFDIDRIANGELSVDVKPPEELAGDEETRRRETAVLLAKYRLELAGEAAAKTKAIRFFAVPAMDVGNFTLASASRAGSSERLHADVSFTGSRTISPADDGSTATLECAVELTRDVDGREIRYGETYQVFSLRVPKASEPVIGDFSFPSLPLTPLIPLSFATEPQVFLLADGNFLVAFEGVDRSEEVASYELFLHPNDTTAEIGDDLVRGGAATVANATSFEPEKNQCDDAEATLKAIARKLASARQAAGAAYGAPLDDALEPVRDWLQTRRTLPNARPAYVACFSPLLAGGAALENGFATGRYVGMYGAPVDFRRTQYSAIVRAIRLASRRTGAAAACVLSPASSPFPVVLENDVFAPRTRTKS